MRPLSSSANPPPLAARDDAALLRALSLDDTAAFAAIYERYWDALHAHAGRKLGCPHEAEEIVQDLFVALWHKRHSADIQQLKPYLFAALKYRLIDSIRARLVRQAHAATPPPRADHGTEETVAAADLHAALDASVRQLPAHAQKVFRLSRLEHRTVPEIAAHLQVSAKTVEYHLARSLKLMRGYLREFLLGLVLLTGLGA
ncbi:sigma-70 family RNA polymerase sigma factor [Hymenobacter sp. UYCo722]|uniref:RNA polymerase sigma factor n=1 Tax=Hymenobacter sp. UYCo722 TaxID=3156335 RepID=UPI0033947558